MNDQRLFLWRGLITGWIAGIGAMEIWSNRPLALLTISLAVIPAAIYFRLSGAAVVPPKVGRGHFGYRLYHRLFIKGR